MISREDLIKQYDAIYRRGLYGGANNSHKLVMNQVPAMHEHGVKSILDLGCGRGKLMNMLEVHGFDCSGTECVPYLLSGALKDMQVYPFMAHEMDPIEDMSYDLVTSINFFDHLPNHDDMKIAIRESFRIARLGVIAVIHGDPILQSIFEDETFWQDQMLRQHKPVRFIRNKRGTMMFCSWMFEEELRADPSRGQS
jgi:SAM-dependent methyltransferase